MAILKVARMGNPILRLKAAPVTKDEILTPAFQSFIEDMVETMEDYGGVGLAAPQVHVSKQVLVARFSAENSRYPGEGEHPLSVLINPIVQVLDENREGYWEGCLSVPGLRGWVERPRKIKVNYLDRQGNPQEEVAEGFLATVYQHEIDHLHGVIYVDRLTDPTRFGFIEDLDRA